MNVPPLRGCILSWLCAAVAVCLLMPALAASRAQAAVWLQATETPKLTPITEEPSQVPTSERPSSPTSEPVTPTPLMELPTIAPTPTATSEPAEAPPAATLEATAIPAQPTRTRRPTRTPRSQTTAEPTPAPAGALRVEVALDPPLPAPGLPCRVLVDVANRDTAPLADVTLDVTVPSFARIEDATPTSGEAALVETVARWYLPTLAAGSQVRLTLQLVVMPASARSLDVCVMMLSTGAPLEHCSLFGLGAGSGGDSQAARAWEAREGTSPVLPTAPPSGLLSTDVPRQVLWGWLLMFLGLAGLGAWFGLQLRSRVSPGNAPPADEGEVR